MNTDNDSLWVFSVLPSFDRDGGRVKTLNGVLESLRELERDVVVVAVGGWNTVLDSVKGEFCLD